MAATGFPRLCILAGVAALGCQGPTLVPYAVGPDKFPVGNGTFGLVAVRFPDSLLGAETGIYRGYGDDSVVTVLVNIHRPPATAAPDRTNDAEWRAAIRSLRLLHPRHRISLGPPQDTLVATPDGDYGVRAALGTVDHDRAALVALVAPGAGFLLVSVVPGPEAAPLLPLVLEFVDYLARNYAARRVPP